MIENPRYRGPIESRKLNSNINLIRANLIKIFNNIKNTEDKFNEYKGCSETQLSSNIEKLQNSLVRIKELKKTIFSIEIK